MIEVPLQGATTAAGQKHVATLLKRLQCTGDRNWSLFFGVYLNGRVTPDVWGYRCSLLSGRDILCEHLQVYLSDIKHRPPRTLR
jgi:hypothetical protein